MAKVLIADDHELVRRGIRSLLETFPHLEVAGEASNGREAVEKVRSLRPDVVLIDVCMPELNGVDATRQILQAAPRTEVMVVSVDHSASVLRRVLEAGARGYVLKSDTGPTIVAGIQSLLEHKPFFSTAVSEAVLGAFLSAGAEDERRRLTPREVEVLQLLAEGKTTKEIAATLEIGVKTAETHRANVMNKAGARTTSELARYAVRLGIIEG